MKHILLSLLALFLVLNIHATEWEGKWIVVFDNQNITNSWYAFRKQINIKKTPKTAIAKIAVDSKYWLWINGRQIVFEGGLKRGPNPTDTYYDEVNIAPWLHEGINTIAVLTWYFGKDGFSHISSGKAGLLFDCVTPDFKIISDKTWKGSLLKAYSTSSGVQANFRLSESNILYDARKDIGNWTSPEYDDKRMKEVRIFGTAGCYPWNKLHKRPIPIFKDYGLKSYDNISYNGDTIICKLPYNCQLTPYIKLKSPAGKQIKIFTDNYLLFDPSYCIYGEYITKNGIQEYESLAWINGHKVYYILPEGAEMLSVQYRETGYNCTFDGSFNSDDSFLNKLWEKARRTLYVTMRDNFMDCPDRERAQWAGDAVNESLEAYYALSPYCQLLVKKWLSETVNWQRPDGSMFAPVPAGNWFDELPGQVLATIGEYGIWYYYMFSGDRELIRELYPKIKKYLALWKSDGKGLIRMREGDWTWGDWGNNKDMNSLFNLWYYIAIRGMYNIASELNYTNDKIQYDTFIKEFKEAFNKQYWNGKAYRDPDYKEATDDRVQALAVVSDIADKSKYPALLKVLQQEEHASPYMEKYVFEAMMKMGYEKAAINRHKSRFSYMVNHPDFSTLFEGWGIGENGFGGGTVNHGWSGGGLAICSQYICGISPLTPGFKTFQIMPQPGPLKNATVTVPTISGTIKSEFKIDNNSFYLNAEIPKGTEAIIGIPLLKKYRTIVVNNTMIWKNGKYMEVNVISPVTDTKDTKYIKLRCNSGNYSIYAK